MRSVAMPLAEKLVEAMLGRGERLRDAQAETAEPWRADRHEQRLDRFDSALEIRDPPLYELLARKPSRRVVLLHTKTVASAAAGGSA